MMRTTFSLLLLFVSSLHGANNLDIYFDIENRNQSLSIVELKAAAEAKKIIRDNAYLGLSNKFKSDQSLCWLNFIKNRKHPYSIRVILTTFFLQQCHVPRN